jgi:hypothetical protein
MLVILEFVCLFVCLARNCEEIMLDLASATLESTFDCWEGGGGVTTYKFWKKRAFDKIKIEIKNSSTMQVLRIKDSWVLKQGNF